MIQTQKDDNQKWYDQRMAEDYTKRTDIQNALRLQDELIKDQYQKAKASSVVSGATDESLALQKAAANKAAGDTLANIASQASDYKEGVEQQFMAKNDALTGQQISAQQNKAQNIANAAGQIGSAVSGLMTGAVGDAIDNAIKKKES